MLDTTRMGLTGISGPEFEPCGNLENTVVACTSIVTREQLLFSLSVNWGCGQLGRCPVSKKRDVEAIN